MSYIVINSAGRFTGTVYDQWDQRHEDHHAQYGEMLIEHEPLPIQEEWSPSQYPKVEMDTVTAKRAVVVQRMVKQKLLDSDPVSAYDAPEKSKTLSAEMTAYRQALRDVNHQEGFPLNVVWPTLPI